MRREYIGGNEKGVYRGGGRREYMGGKEKGVYKRE